MIVSTNKVKSFQHGSLNLDQENMIIFTSYSKKNFYTRAEVSQFVLRAGHTPINPFMNFDYNLSGVVDRSLIRVANNTMIAAADELWVFGDISDGVLVEIYLAKKQNKHVRYFMISNNDFHEVDELSARLEDVSEWQWEYVRLGRDLARWHPRLRFHKTYPLVYPAYSKHNFYLQMHISKYCLENHVVPLNPFMLFRYFIGDSVSRETIYRANNNIVRIADEVWVFDEVSDGVLAEVKLKKERGHVVKYFSHTSDSFPITYRKLSPLQVRFEDGGLEQYRNLLSE